MEWFEYNYFHIWIILNNGCLKRKKINFNSFINKIQKKHNRYTSCNRDISNHQITISIKSKEVYVYVCKCIEANNECERYKEEATIFILIPDYSNRFANLFCDNCNGNLDMILHYQRHYYYLLVWLLMIYLKDFFPVLNNVHIPNVFNRKVFYEVLTYLFI